MQKIQKNDNIIVISGKDRGSLGTVSMRFDAKVIVDGINLVKKHQKPNPQAGVEGGIRDKEMPMDVSNVAIYNPETKKADRVCFSTNKDGKKVRLYKSTKKPI